MKWYKWYHAYYKTMTKTTLPLNYSHHPPPTHKHWESYLPVYLDSENVRSYSPCSNFTSGDLQHSSFSEGWGYLERMHFMSGNCGTFPLIIGFVWPFETDTRDPGEWKARITTSTRFCVHGWRVLPVKPHYALHVAGHAWALTPVISTWVPACLLK